MPDPAPDLVTPVAASESPAAAAPGPVADAAVLDRLFTTVMARRGSDPEQSYTARLFNKGTRKIAQKLGEEAVEAVIEVMRGDSERLIDESADLLYHLVVAWAETGVRPDDVYRRLAQREGTSGVAEKRSRRKDGGERADRS